LAIGCWLLDIGYWLFAIGYWLFGYWLLAIGYWLLAIGYWLLAVVYCLCTPAVLAAALPAPVHAVARIAVLAAALGSPVHAVARTAVLARNWLFAYCLFKATTAGAATPVEFAGTVQSLAGRILAHYSNPIYESIKRGGVFIRLR
jgi:hypothetical protein